MRFFWPRGGISTVARIGGGIEHVLRAASAPWAGDRQPTFPPRPAQPMRGRQIRDRPCGRSAERQRHGGQRTSARLQTSRLKHPSDRIPECGATLQKIDGLASPRRTEFFQDSLNFALFQSADRALAGHEHSSAPCRLTVRLFNRTLDRQHAQQSLCWRIDRLHRRQRRSSAPRRPRTPVRRFRTVT